MTNPIFAYVGCYTTKERDGCGKGINVYRLDAGMTKWTNIQLVEEYFNPSFLALDMRQEFLYSVHGDGMVVSAFKINKVTGMLSLINVQPTNGKNGVHLSVDPSNCYVLVANYSTGTIATLPINPDGSLAPLTDLVALQGKVGPVPHEQPFSHPHHIPFHPNGKFFYVPDKGFDKIFVYHLDTATGKFIGDSSANIETKPGIAPRHIDFHPAKPYAYVLNELSSTITTYLVNESTGKLKPVQTLSTLPSGFTTKNKSAEIVVDPSGMFVYASNRGHDSITIFQIDQHTGCLEVIDWISSNGKKPRFITISPSGHMLFVANEDSHTIFAFAIDITTGKLTMIGEVAQIGSPSCIVFKTL